jgi:UDPglucose 6-dehydrogenase
VIYFMGSSHAPTTLAAAAMAHGLAVTEDLTQARLVFVSEDTPTDEDGKRNLEPIRNLVQAVLHDTHVPVVLTSQVPPGFTRKMRSDRLYHMAETLRMKDAMQRAKYPEQFIVGVSDPNEYTLPLSFMQYLYAHGDPYLHVMSFEDAEFAKIAINMTLAAQVENTNRLAEAAKKVGARWSAVAEALKCDKRIGPESYLTPGDWKKSRHLLRDHVTLEALLAR